MVVWDLKEVIMLYLVYTILDYWYKSSHSTRIAYLKLMDSISIAFADNKLTASEFDTIREAAVVWVQMRGGL